MKNLRKHALPKLITLHKVMVRHGKRYCYPSQDMILYLLAAYQDEKISKSTLNRHLRDMQDIRVVTRTRRTKKDKKRGKMFLSSMYTITVQGYHMMAAAGIDVWKDMQAAKAAAFKAAERALSKRTGPVSLKTILAAPMIFGVREKTWLVEK